MISEFPHCDQRVLHAPSTCAYCDAHPEWQALREAWGIAFTGQEAPFSGTRIEPDQWHQRDLLTYRTIRARGQSAVLPCPADFNRPPTGDGSDHRRWAGNVATTEDPVNETAASEMLYGHMARPGKRRRQLEQARTELGAMLRRLSGR